MTLHSSRRQFIIERPCTRHLRSVSWLGLDVNTFCMTIFNALIRTHHITSRKKVTKLRQAADNHNVLAFLRSGGAPGIMYVEGRESGVRDWVEVVHNLRYKDYQLACKPNDVQREGATVSEDTKKQGLYELSTVKDFAQAMHDRGCYSWWRRGMGYDTQDKIL